MEGMVGRGRDTWGRAALAEDGDRVENEAEWAWILTSPRGFQMTV